MSICATEEEQKDLEYQAMLDAKYGYYDDYEDYLYEDDYDNECVIKNKCTKSKTKKECKVIKFPMSSSEVNMKNKKCDYKTLAIMTYYSNYNSYDKEDHRYVYKNDILLNKDEIEGWSKNKIDTVCRNIKKLCKLENNIIEAKNTDNGIVYLINYKDKNNRKFVTIEDEILKLLLDGCSSNVIKTYIFIKYRCEFNGNKETKLTRKDIVDNVGLSIKSEKNLDKAKRWIYILKGANLIKVNSKYEVEVDELSGNEIVKKFNYYQIVEYEDWIKKYNKEN